MADKITVKNRLRGVLDPVVNVLARIGIPPMAVTVAGLLLSLVGAAAIARGAFRAGGVLVIVSGICDTLDGSLARKARRESVFGAFIDSTIDRVTELACFGALVVYYASRGEPERIALILAVVALSGSFLTSYTRARAEGLGLECRVGLLERPERVAILVLGLLLGARVLFVALAALAVLTVVTSVQRIAHVYRLASRGGTE